MEVGFFGETKMASVGGMGVCKFCFDVGFE